MVLVDTEVGYNARQFLAVSVSNNKGKNNLLTHSCMISEKLKLQKGQFFVDRFVHNFNELEKVFLPTRFNLAYAGKHISILLCASSIFKG